MCLIGNWFLKVTLLPRLWLENNNCLRPTPASSLFSSEIHHRDAARRESQEKRECKILFKPDFAFLYNGGLPQSFSLPSQSTRDIILMRIICLSPSNANYHIIQFNQRWYLLEWASCRQPLGITAERRNKGQSCFILGFKNWTAYGVGSGFGDKEVPPAIHFLVLLSWDWAQMQTLPCPLPSFLPPSSTEPCMVSEDCQDCHGGMTSWHYHRLAGKNWGEGKGWAFRRVNKGAQSGI